MSDGRGSAARADDHIPDWLVRHPLIAGWAWVALWLAIIVIDEFVDWAGWSWYVVVAMSAVPTLLAALAVLHATPRAHLKPATESVLGHFFVRFLVLVGAFVVWAISIVLSASISTTIQTAVANVDREVMALGFNLLVAAVPLVVTVLWLTFIVRCAWFLRRLRGWRERPTDSRVPPEFLGDRPRLRAVVIGLAHPGLLLVGGLGASVLLLLLGSVELTLNVFA